jgi:hypothetical protein
VESLKSPIHGRIRIWAEPLRCKTEKEFFNLRLARKCGACNFVSRITFPTKATIRLFLSGNLRRLPQFPWTTRSSGFA